jgi:hypothetical protein
LAAPIKRSVNIFLPTFKNSFDSAVASVAHPSRNPKSFSGALGLRPKKHPLNPSGYNGMSPYLFFHLYLANIWLERY